MRVGRESKGRKGKTVTLVSGLALEGPALHALLSDLKRLCGAGGALTPRRTSAFAPRGPPPRR